MNQFDQVMKRGLNAFFRTAGETVTYFPHDGNPFELRASRCELNPVSEGDPRRRAVARGVHFEVFSSDLAEKLARKPRVGDWIQGENGVRYDAATIPGSLCYEYPTPEQITILIHTVEAPSCP